MDFIQSWNNKTEIPKAKFLLWIGLGESKFYSWTARYGKINEHNGNIPRDFWLENWEKEAILAFHSQYPLEGYRRLSFMMIDRSLVCVSPSSVYRVLKNAGLLDNRELKKSKKGTGFEQPLGPNQHWHTDVSYLNISGTFYYLASVLDGYSRKIIAWEIRESMKEEELEIIIERAKEAYPDARPRVISDRGPQFVSKDFKEFIRLSGMTHVMTSPYYPQSNGKIERWHRSIKEKCVRPKCPGTVQEAREIVSEWIAHCNNERLHSAIGYVTPADMMDGRADAIQKLRDKRLEEAREYRRKRRIEAESQSDIRQLRMS